MAAINTNVQSLTAQINLARSAVSLGKSVERLSSGLRINSAADNAAGQAIANRMTAQIRGMKQAERNANDGISLLQTQEAGLGEINTNLQRIRELAVQAASDTNTASDRTSISTEITQRVQEIDRIAQTAAFNGTKLLAAAGNLNIQVGSQATTNDQISLTTISATSTTLGVNALTVTSAATSQTSITSIDAAIATVDTARSTIGAKQNRLESTVNNLATTVENLSAARSRIQDTDYASEVSEMTKAQILQQAGNSVLSQANSIPQGVLKLLG